MGRKEIHFMGQKHNFNISKVSSIWTANQMTMWIVKSRVVSDFKGDSFKYFNPVKIYSSPGDGIGSWFRKIVLYCIEWYKAKLRVCFDDIKNNHRVTDSSRNSIQCSIDIFGKISSYLGFSQIVQPLACRNFSYLKNY